MDGSVGWLWMMSLSCVVGWMVGWEDRSGHVAVAYCFSEDCDSYPAVHFHCLKPSTAITDLLKLAKGQGSRQASEVKQLRRRMTAIVAIVCYAERHIYIARIDHHHPTMYKSAFCN
ncbi:hypothetical protein KC356_g172 [Hortaea werneckii]|nr:hypothetical protein KC356_g172 [Hortaea werneckii]